MSSVFTRHSLDPLDREKDPATPDGTRLKRRRGRPRKDEVQGPSTTVRKRSSSVPVNPALMPSDELIGQQVHGVLDGIFDAGYLLTAQVGHDGPMLSGMVFSPGQPVPITPENDIAPHLPMCHRGEFPLHEGPTPPSSSNQSHPTLKKAKSIEPSQTLEVAVSSRGMLPNHAGENSNSNAQTSPGYTKKVMQDDASQGLQNVPVLLQNSASNSSQAILEAVGVAKVTPLTTPSQTETYDARVGMSGPSAVAVNLDQSPGEAPKGTEDAHEVGGTVCTVTTTDNRIEQQMNDENAAGLPDSTALPADQVEVASTDVCSGSKGPVASEAPVSLSTWTFEANPEPQQVNETYQPPSSNGMPSEAPGTLASFTTRSLESNPEPEQVNEVSQPPSPNQMPFEAPAIPASSATQALEASSEPQQVNEISQHPSGSQMPSEAPATPAASPATRALEANLELPQVNETSQLPSGNYMPTDHSLEH